MKTLTKLWIGIWLLAFLSPCGLFLPRYFKAGGAWGEWRLGKLSGFWSPPMPGYSFAGWVEKGPARLGIAYCLSAALGIAILVIALLLIGRFLAKKGA